MSGVPRNEAGPRRFALREQAERDGGMVPGMLYERLVSLRG